jgi:hypothetical protein
MSLQNSKEYLKKYENLKNGYYEYKIDGYVHNLYTIFEDRTGWIKVSTVDANNNHHLNHDNVTNVKVHDGVINLLRTDYEYNVMAKVNYFNLPFNEWLRYPHIMYVHSSMTEFHSTKTTAENPNSTFVSFDLNSPPMKNIRPNDINIGFGNGNVGDTLFSYGCNGRNGFFQSFSGSGSGELYVR